MSMLIAALAFAAAQAAQAAPVDHSQHTAAQHAQKQEQQAQHLPGQHQNHAEMMKHCQDMMTKMHKSMHEGDGGQHKGHSGQ